MTVFSKTRTIVSLVFPFPQGEITDCTSRKNFLLDKAFCIAEEIFFSSYPTSRIFADRTLPVWRGPTFTTGVQKEGESTIPALLFPTQTRAYFSNDKKVV